MEVPACFPHTPMYATGRGAAHKIPVFGILYAAPDPERARSAALVGKADDARLCGADRGRNGVGGAGDRCEHETGN
jgi:hypothetical protein